MKDGKISLSIKALLENDEDDTASNVEIPKAEELTTSMGALLKNIKL